MSASSSSSTAAAPAATAAKKCGLVWYKCSDLRTLDHEPLALAHAENTNVCHLFCFDPRWFGEAGGPSAPGTLKTGALRARFLLEAVEDLKGRLQDNIVIKLGKPEVEVPRMAKALGATTVYAHREVTSEELAVVKGVKEGLQKATEGKSKLKEVWGNYLYHINDLPFDNVKQDMPDVFTQFRKAVESKSRVRKYLPTPSPLKPPPPADAAAAVAAAEEAAVNALASPLTLQALGFTSEEDLAPVVEYGSDARVNPAAVLMFKGGETAGLARVRDYLWEKDLVRRGGREGERGGL
jgi:deoxyribodipyrimidine photo-lyase